jgi:hypothetical protein
MMAGAAALPAVSRIAIAQTYPTRPVRIIVPLMSDEPAGAARSEFRSPRTPDAHASLSITSSAPGIC